MLNITHATVDLVFFLALRPRMRPACLTEPGAWLRLSIGVAPPRQRSFPILVRACPVGKTLFKVSANGQLDDVLPAGLLI